MNQKHLKTISIGTVAFLLPTLILYGLRIRLQDALLIGFSCLCFYLAILMVVSPSKRQIPSNRMAEKRPPSHYQYEDEYSEPEYRPRRKEYSPFDQREPQDEDDYQEPEPEPEIRRKTIIKYKRRSVDDGRQQDDNKDL